MAYKEMACKQIKMTLKVSTIEQTAEQAEARGGKGNAPLIIWDLISAIGPLAA